MRSNTVRVEDSRHSVTKYILKIISIIEVVGGLLGVVTSIIVALHTPKSPLNFLLVPLFLALFVAAYSLMAYAGVQLWRDKTLGLRLSMVAQIIQIPFIQSSYIAFRLYSPLTFYTIFSENGFMNNVFGLGSDSVLSFPGMELPFSVGINLIAVLLLIFLIFYYYSVLKNRIGYSLKKSNHDAISVNGIRKINKILLSRKLIKAISVYEMLCGVMSLFLNISTNFNSFSDRVVALVIDVLFIMAGYYLWRSKRIGYVSSIALQGLSIFSLNSAFFSYSIVAPGGLFIGFVSLGHFIDYVSAIIFTNYFYLRFNLGQEGFSITINCLSLLVFMCLSYYYYYFSKKIKNN